MTLDHNTVLKNTVSLRAQGMSGRQVCDALNNLGFTTARGNSWNFRNLSSFLTRNRNELRRLEREAGRTDHESEKPAPQPPRPVLQEMTGTDVPSWALAILRKAEWSPEKKVRVLLACVEP